MRSHLRNFDLVSLRLFVATCECGSIARAGDQENIAGSAISKRIAQMEADAGITLLTRFRRGVQPTPAGRVVLEHAQRVLFALDRMEIDLSAYGEGSRGHVRLHVTPSAIEEMLLDRIASFLQEPNNRGIKVDIEERRTSDIVAMLTEGSASIGICWENSSVVGLEHRAYRHDQLALAVPLDHALSHRQSISFEETLDHEHVGMPPASAVQKLQRLEAGRLGRTINYRIFVSNFFSAFSVVASGLAVGIMPILTGEPFGALRRIKMVPLTDPWASRRFVVCFRSHAHLQPAAIRMVDHLTRCD